MIKTLNLQTSKRIEAVNITYEVKKIVDSSNKDDGLCLIYTPHTTAAIIINEGADPDVMGDLLKHLESLVPHNNSYRHIEGNSDSHIKASIIGNSRMVAFENKKLLLGRWEAVYFLEFDGPRNRKVYISLI